MSRVDEIIKNLDTYRDRQFLCMVFLWVASGFSVLWTYNREPKYALISALSAGLATMGITYYSNKTNGINRELILETNKAVWGGDSYGFIGILPLGNGTASVTFQSAGNFPIFNLSIKIFDNHKNEAIHRRYTLTNPTFALQEINSGQVLKLGNIPLVNRNEYNILVYYEARNKRWFQEVSLKRDSENEVAGTISYYGNTRVYEGTTSEGKLLLAM